MLHRMKNKIDANMYKPSDTKYIDRHDRDLYWPTSIKDTIQWFPVFTTIEHTANVINQNKGLFPSLLNVFFMFQLCLFDDKYEVEIITIRCINCKKETGLYLINSTFEEIITKFVLNAILHHVGMSWIICSNKEMKYEIDEINHQYWLNKGPWYNTDICSKLYGEMFEAFITHTITDRYYLLCSIVSHDKKQHLHEDEESSIGDRPIPKKTTTESLEALGVTFNFIDVWIKLMDKN